MKVLITSGGTREPIDGVRVITNLSSGSTGAFLTDYFRGRGHNVTLLHAKDSKNSNLPGESHEFTSFEDLEGKLQNLLYSSHYNVVLHLAAISDYSVDSIVADGKTYKPDAAIKINSDANSITLHLKKNKKLINQLKNFAINKDFILVGFKLTNTPSQQERRSAVARLAEDFNIDYIVHNDLSEIKKDGTHIATIYKGSNEILKVRNKTELASELERIITREAL